MIRTPEITSRGLIGASRLRLEEGRSLDLSTDYVFGQWFSDRRIVSPETRCVSRTPWPEDIESTWRFTGNTVCVSTVVAEIDRDVALSSYVTVSNVRFTGNPVCLLVEGYGRTPLERTTRSAVGATIRWPPLVSATHVFQHGRPHGKS